MVVAPRFLVAVHALFVIPDGRFLVTRRSAANPYAPGQWDLPGGAVEPGETTEAALRREVAEETGLVATGLVPLFIHTNLADLPRLQAVQIVYRATLCASAVGAAETPVPRLDPCEHDAYRYVTAAEARALPLMPFVSALLDAPCGVTPP